MAGIFLVNMAFLLFSLHATKQRALEGKAVCKTRVLANEFAQRSVERLMISWASTLGWFVCCSWCALFQANEPGQKHQYQSELSPRGEMVELLNALVSWLSGTETQEKVESRKHP